MAFTICPKCSASSAKVGGQREKERGTHGQKEKERERKKEREREGKKEVSREIEN